MVDTMDAWLLALLALLAVFALIVVAVLLESQKRK
jgi:hypothetical protein